MATEPATISSSANDATRLMNEIADHVNMRQVLAGLLYNGKMDNELTVVFNKLGTNAVFLDINTLSAEHKNAIAAVLLDVLETRTYELWEQLRDVVNYGYDLMTTYMLDRLNETDPRENESSNNETIESLFIQKSETQNHGTNG